MSIDMFFGKKENIFLCKKKLWLDMNRKSDNLHKNGDIAEDYSAQKVKELAYNSFAPSFRISQKSQIDAAVETAEIIKNCNGRTIITDAAFAFENSFIHIDRLLVRADKSIEVCDIKAAVHIRDGFIKDISYKCAILKLYGYDVKRVYIRYINGSYVRNGDIDAERFFLYKDVTQEVLVYAIDMTESIQSVRNETEEPACCICAGCLSPYKCDHWDICTSHFPENNVFNVSGLSMDKKFEFLNSGIVSFEDIVNAGCVSKRQMEQVVATLNSESPKVDKKELKKVLDEFTYPLYFLDFETFQSAIPRFDGVMPFTQIPFQYSLHYYESENGELFHKEYLADFGRDPRRELAERLVSDIPLDVCVLAYNMAFEKEVIRSLAFMFPDLYTPLMRIRGNIRDLMVPFRKHLYYDRKMNGSHSLKAVLPALFPDDEELDYKKLDTVHNGLEAMITYQQAFDEDESSRRLIRRNLLKYCGLDTYAMVKILQKLNDAVK